MATLDLGGLDLVSTTGRLLTLASRAYVSSSTIGAGSLTTALFHKDSTSRPWVDCSSNFHLDLLLEFGTGWQHWVAQERLIERLASTLSETGASLGQVLTASLTDTIW